MCRQLYDQYSDCGCVLRSDFEKCQYGPVDPRCPQVVGAYVTAKQPECDYHSAQRMREAERALLRNQNGRSHHEVYRQGGHGVDEQWSSSSYGHHAVNGQSNTLSYGTNRFGNYGVSGPSGHSRSYVHGNLSLYGGNRWGHHQVDGQPGYYGLGGGQSCDHVGGASGRYGLHGQSSPYGLGDRQSGSYGLGGGQSPYHHVDGPFSHYGLDAQSGHYERDVQGHHVDGQQSHSNYGTKPQSKQLTYEAGSNVIPWEAFANASPKTEPSTWGPDPFTSSRSPVQSSSSGFMRRPFLGTEVERPAPLSPSPVSTIKGPRFLDFSNAESDAEADVRSQIEDVRASPHSTCSCRCPVHHKDSNLQIQLEDIWSPSKSGCSCPCPIHKDSDERSWVKDVQASPHKDSDFHIQLEDPWSPAQLGCSCSCSCPIHKDSDERSQIEDVQASLWLTYPYPTIHDDDTDEAKVLKELTICAIRNNQGLGYYFN